MQFPHRTPDTPKSQKRQKLEVKIQMARLKFHVGLIKFLVCCTIAQQIITNFLNPFSRSILETKYFILDAFLLGSVLFGVILTWKKSLYSEKCIVIIIILHLVFLLELKKDLYSVWPKNVFFTFGALYQLLLLSMPLGRVSWRSSTFVGFFVNILLLTRYLEYEDNYKSKYILLSLFSLMVFVVGLSSYKLEKHERHNFLQTKKLKANQKKLINLILDVLPSAALVIKCGKIISTNDKVEKMFNKLSNEEILDETKKIKIKSNFNDHEKGDSPIYFGRREPTEDNNKVTEQNGLIYNKEEEDLTLFDIINQNSHPEFKKYVGVISKTEEIPRNEDSTYVDISVSKILWNDDDALFLFIHENEMAQKYNELDRQAKYKDKLLATVSHDLRTPLNGIIGMIRLALDKVNDESVKESLYIAERSSQLLLNMINDLLDLSQISNGSLRLSFKTFSILDLIEEISQLISFQAKCKGLEFIIEKNLNKSTYLIYNDPSRLKQIILNLLGNALKFTEHGFIKITIENSTHVNLFDSSSNMDMLDNKERNHYSSYSIKVEDSGSGIKKEDIPKLFKLFGKLETDESKRINQTGVGLGLSISQNLALLLNKNLPGFEITVTSEVGRGSCFSFCIQSFEDEIKESNIYEELGNQVSEFIHVVPDFGKKTIATIPIKNKADPKKRILVVEDDPINIMVVTTYLKFYDDIIFDVCHNGRDAFDKVKTMASFDINYDLILMDCNMPIMDGFQATRKILEFLIEDNKPPLLIVAMTANASPIDYENCFQAGMKDYISKPFTRERLRELIIKYRK